MGTLEVREDRSQPGSLSGESRWLSWVLAEPLGGRTAVKVSTSLFLLGWGIWRKSWRFWAQVLGPERTEALGVDSRHECPYCGLVSGSQRCNHVRVIKAEVGHSLKRCLSPCFEHTHPETDRGRNLGTSSLHGL